LELSESYHILKWDDWVFFLGANITGNVFEPEKRSTAGTLSGDSESDSSLWGTWYR